MMGEAEVSSATRCRGSLSSGCVACTQQVNLGPGSYTRTRTGRTCINVARLLGDGFGDGIPKPNAIGDWETWGMRGS